VQNGGFELHGRARSELIPILVRGTSGKIRELAGHKRDLDMRLYKPIQLRDGFLATIANGNEIQVKAVGYVPPFGLRQQIVKQIELWQGRDGD